MTAATDVEAIKLWRDGGLQDCSEYATKFIGEPVGWLPVCANHAIGPFPGYWKLARTRRR